MNDQVAELLVVVDLKLRKEAHGITMDSNAFGQRDDAKKNLQLCKKLTVLRTRYIFYLYSYISSSYCLVSQTCISPEMGWDWIFVPSAVCEK